LPVILIGIGANLPGPDGAPPLLTARWAAAQLEMLPDLRLVCMSRWYLSEPIPPSSQPPYINAVARLEARSAAEADAAELLVWLQALEASAGRVRGERNAARTLDLDIIAMGVGGQTVRATPDPVLPHPRAHLRAFVLVPLREVAPDWQHPVFHLGVQALIDALPPQSIEALV
jgi:2-amino-4-hydroxy-6-hydroxymethyldihydropteridine diphosphokinase